MHGERWRYFFDHDAFTFGIAVKLLGFEVKEENKLGAGFDCVIVVGLGK